MPDCNDLKWMKLSEDETYKQCDDLKCVKVVFSSFPLFIIIVPPLSFHFWLYLIKIMNKSPKTGKI